MPLIVAPTPIPAFAPVLRLLLCVGCAAFADEEKVCEYDVSGILVEGVTDDVEIERDVLGMVDIVFWECDVVGMLVDEIGDEIDAIKDVERELNVL